ncbi:D-glycero-beta-D-manno-heptose 1-phosphate adenylyltransferase [bacterium]|nr:D-glycero-beta-D-manno-heptose 1-phosphate adenylyltransferase [bacterium]
MESKIVDRQTLIKRRQEWVVSGKTVVFTNGCFDILHAGHVSYLEDAKQLGDILIVGLNSDASVQRLKGPQRPINSEHARAIVIAGLEAVDAVCIFEEDTPTDLLRAITPSIHTKGGDYSANSLPEYPVVMSYGGTVKIIPFRPGFSTTSTIERIHRLG